MRFFSDFPRLQCNYTTTASSFDDNKFNSPTLSHQLFCLDAARIASSRFFKIDQNAETQAKTENEKKNLFPFSSMCVEFSSITAPYETHTRNPSRFVDIREMLRLTSTKEEKQTEHTKKNLGRCPSTTGFEPWPTRNRYRSRDTLTSAIRFTVKFLQLFNL